jgi:type IV pilus assembly protein PilB
MVAKEEALKKSSISEGSQPSKKRGIGWLAVDAGLITEKQLAAAGFEQEKTGRPLSDVLQELYGLGSDNLQALIAEDAGIERVDLARIDVDREALGKVPVEFALKNKLFPISLSQDRLIVAMANPFELATLDQLQFITRLYVDARYASASDIETAIEKYYEVRPEGHVQTVRNDDKPQSGQSLDEGKGTEGLPVVKLVDALLRDAVREEATDIHIEPGEKGMKVRFRIDGVLHFRLNINKALQPPVISRIKIMANLDISENRIPQDGRIGFSLEKRNYDLRVSTFPTIYGEKIVMRVLDKERMIVGVEDLGLSPSSFEIFKKCVQRPNGIILVTGPTGSGKTTTLYSVLAFVNTAERNTVTLEDPVEYEIANVNQSQINPKAGLTFASGLRAILRQDPDIILLGEMRDAETVDVAIRAALTGHLVFSTLHTNDAVGAIPRLLDMDVNPYLMASSLVAVIGQRLLRMICIQCKDTSEPESGMLEMLGLDPTSKENTFYRGKGCPRCFETGYRGRMAIFEVLAFSEAIAEMIAQRSSSQDIFQKAREEGMTTMMEDGIQKARLGITTLEEVFRVAYSVEAKSEHKLIEF